MATGKNKTKRTPIDEWYAAQDRAVGRVYARLRKQRPNAESATEGQPGNERDRALARVLYAFQTMASIRREIKDAGYDPEILEGIINEGQSLNRQLVRLVEGGYFDEKNCPLASHHRIILVKESIDGERVSRVFIDGNCTFWRPDTNE